MSDALSTVFTRFAKEEFHEASPLYERLALGVAADADLLGLAAHCRKGERIPNLFFAAVHYLLLSRVAHPLTRFYRSLGGNFDGREDPMADFRSFCLQHGEQLRSLIATRLVQTNEVSRCAGLMPLFVEASKRALRRPLFLADIGASAGLNLCWDQYAYKYGNLPPAGVVGSPVQIEGALRGAKVPELPAAFPSIVGRVGVDLNPLDVNKEDDALWLRGLVWPEHEKRAALLSKAMEVARQLNITLIAGDGVDRLSDVMHQVPEHAVLCLMRVFTRLPEPSRERWRDLITDYGAKRNIMVITSRPHGGDDSELILTSIVNGVRTEAALIRMQNHGSWVEFLDQQ